MVRNVSVKMTVKQASEYYHHPQYRYNCAQAIVCHYGGSEKEISEMKALGSGRAPEGFCGALHGALYILKKHNLPRESGIEIFSCNAGSPYCRQIRKQKKISCRQCVEIADQALTAILKSQNLYDK